MTSQTERAGTTRWNPPNIPPDVLVEARQSLDHGAFPWPSYPPPFPEVVAPDAPPPVISFPDDGFFDIFDEGIYSAIAPEISEIAVGRPAPGGLALPESCTSEQARRLARVILAGYPAADADSLFTSAGVDARSLPELDAGDAFAATQAALWAVFHPADHTSARGPRFYDPETGQPHAKTGRLERVVQYLLEQGA